jgi:hypothetical protein
VTLIEWPVTTDTFDTRADYSVDVDALYIFGQSAEERSHFEDAWKTAQGCEFMQLEEAIDELQVRQVPDGEPVSLRSEKQLGELLASGAGRLVVIDITGLSHHVWAPLLQTALSVASDVDVVYVEPGEYRFSDVPRAGEVFDLSSRIRGISPLPGFARLARRFDQDSIFVPLLGFEGARLQYVMEQVQPAGGQTFPIVGVPGFRPEYPFYTFEGNEPGLTSVWKDVRLAAANCPFELFAVLTELADRYETAALKVAPIGTKPHAVGAILHALAHPDRVELVYDHPERKPGRTEGEFRTLVYHASIFMRSASSAPVAP